MDIMPFGYKAIIDKSPENIAIYFDLCSIAILYDYSFRTD